MFEFIIQLFHTLFARTNVFKNEHKKDNASKQQ